MRNWKRLVLSSQLCSKIFPSGRLFLRIPSNYENLSFSGPSSQQGMSFSASSCGMCGIARWSPFSVNLDPLSNTRNEFRHLLKVGVTNKRTSFSSGFVEDSVKAAASNEGNNRNLSPDKEKMPRTLDQVIYHMQADIRAKRRIHQAEIHNAVELVEKAMKVDDFGSFLINCCTDILPDLSAEYRVKLAERIWAVIRKSKEYSADNFEAMLKSLALNEDKVTDPMRYLEEARNVQVDVTPTMCFFALLIVCQRGDIEATVQILSYMKDNGIPVNEKFFNLLILGNGRRGDLESAREILDLMTASRILPSTQTWTMLLQVYIENGDMDWLKKTFNEMAAGQLSEDQFYELLRAAGRQSNPKIFNQVLEWAFASQKLRYLKIRKVSVILMHLGYPENALKIILKFSETLKSERAEYLGAFFIKDLHFLVSNPESYLKLVISLQDDKRNPYALNRAAESCLKHRKFDLLYKIYEVMLVMNVPIRPHYFYVPFICEVEQGEISGAVKVLSKMKALNVKPDWEMLVVWIVPILFEKTGNMLEALKVVNVASDVSYASGLLSAGLLVAVQQGKIKEAISITEHLKGKVINPEILYQSLQRHVCGNGEVSDVALILPILKFLTENGETDETKDFTGALILRLVDTGKFKEAETLLTGAVKFGISVSASVVEAVKCKIEIEDDILTNSGLEIFNGNGRRILNPKEMNVPALESHTQELEGKDLNVRGTYRKLFLKYCQQGNLSKALEVKTKFEENYGDFTSGMKSALMGNYIQNGLLEPALEIFRSFKESDTEDEPVEVDVYKIIDLATLMTKKGLLNEAVTMVQTECTKKTNHRPETISRNIVRFMEAVSIASVTSKVCKENVVQSLADFFLQTKMMNPTNPVLAPVIKDLIRRDKLNEAVEKLEEFSTKFRVVPTLQELTYRVLDKPELLDKVLRCSIAVKGLREGKRLLALAKSDMGDLDGAAALFLELGEQLSFISIIRQCEYLVSRREFDKVINLINALYKTGRGYNCVGLYNIAIKGCERIGDEDSLKRIFSSMQEHDLYVHQKFSKKNPVR